MSIKKAYLVAGLAYGDEGKGSIVDFLARNCKSSPIIIRYNGGPQAAHNVITPEGRHHTFSQFGSGMFVKNAMTYLSEYMLINPLNMIAEEEHLRTQCGIEHVWANTIICEQAIMITPYHVAMNRLVEKKRGDNRHGSCGQGIGIARHLEVTHGRQIVPIMKDLYSLNSLKTKLEFMQRVAKEMVEVLGGSGIDVREEAIIFSNDLIPYLLEQYKRFPGIPMLTTPEWFEAAVSYWDRPVIFEGAQGMMIDETHGKAPHNTWTDCTFNNAEKMLKAAKFNGEAKRIGVVRTYYTRHGAGPFIEDEDLKEKFRATNHVERHNGTNEYQGSFKIGRFDSEEFGYAVDKIGGVDYIALNHCDAPGTGELQNELVKSGKVGIIGWGPSANEKSFTAQFSM